MQIDQHGDPMGAATEFPVILPSETQTREFDAKLLLACFLAERGHPVIVGSRIEIHNRLHSLPRGLYLAKDIRRSSRRVFRIMANLGIAIVAWDEEPIITVDRETYHSRRVDPENLNRIKAFFAWGARSRALIESAPGYRGTPIYETGNPRIDLLMPRCRAMYQPEIDDLRQRYGEFILINSNFGTINHFLNGQTATRNADGSFKNVGAGNAEWWKFRYAAFEGLKAIVPVLARAFPDRKIVIRPHPTESHEAWKEVGRDAANVTVIHEGAVHPWIMASAVAIHNGCTTGLESYLLDHPVIAYYPVTNADFDDQLSNRVSTSAYTEAELLEMLSSFFAGKPLPPCAADARKYVEVQLGRLDGTLCCERIDELIARHGESWLSPAPPLMNRLGGQIRSILRQSVKRLNAHRPGHKNSRQYTMHRFPGLTADQVSERLTTLSGIMNRFSELKVRQLSPNVFEIAK